MGQGTESLAGQVDALLAGRLVIPSIQRGYVWRRSQVTYLLDSLYRGYPVGALLVWKTTMDVPLRAAAVLQNAPTYDHPAILLDGQQRLTSLARVMRPEAVLGASLDVRFDVRTEEFVNPSAVQRKDPLLVPVTGLLNEGAQIAGVLMAAGVAYDAPEFDVYYGRLQKVHGIRQYPLPILTVESDDYEQVADIFARVNQGGRRLSKGDLVYSAVAARWPDGLDRIERFRDGLDSRWSSLDREVVLRLTGLLAGTGAYVVKLLGPRVSGAVLEQAWARTEDAVRRAVDFLSVDCGIPRATVLTSPNVAVVPAYLLHRRNGVLSSDEVDGLRRWVYTAMAFSHYSNQVEGKLDVEARIVDRGGPRMLDELIRRASGPRSVDSPLAPDDLEHRSTSSPLFILLYIAALRAGAKDWKTNTALSAIPASPGGKIEFHHVFPKATVLRRYGAEATNSLANLAFVSGATNRSIGPKPPATYLPTIDPARLAEQWMPGEETWDLDDFETFLARRRELQVVALNRLLGLPPWSRGRTRDEDAEVPDEDDDLADETLFREAGSLDGDRNGDRNGAAHAARSAAASVAAST